MTLDAIRRGNEETSQRPARGSRRASEHTAVITKPPAVATRAPFVELVEREATAVDPGLAQRITREHALAMERLTRWDAGELGPRDDLGDPTQPWLPTRPRAQTEEPTLPRRRDAAPGAGGLVPERTPTGDHDADRRPAWIVASTPPLRPGSQRAPSQQRNASWPPSSPAASMGPGASARLPPPWRGRSTVLATPPPPAFVAEPVDRTPWPPAPPEAGYLREPRTWNRLGRGTAPAAPLRGDGTPPSVAAASFAVVTEQVSRMSRQQRAAIARWFLQGFVLVVGAALIVAQLGSSDTSASPIGRPAEAAAPRQVAPAHPAPPAASGSTLVGAPGGTRPLAAAPRRLVTVRVSSNPSGATVTLDGRRVGQTPLTLERDPAQGTSALRVWRAGYQVRQVALQGDADLDVDLHLQAVR